MKKLAGGPVRLPKEIQSLEGIFSVQDANHAYAYVYAYLFKNII